MEADEEIPLKGAKRACRKTKLSSNSKSSSISDHNLDTKPELRKRLMDMIVRNEAKRRFS